MTYSACILLVNKTFDYLHMQCYRLWLQMAKRNHCAYLLIGKWLEHSLRKELLVVVRDS